MMLLDTLLAAVCDGLSGGPAELAGHRWTRDLPRPWLGWILVALMRQVPRQRWVVRVLADHLPGVMTGEGDVPGLRGWSYRFHGIGCCLVGPSETIDVGFYGDGGLTVDTFFFAHRVLDLKSAALPEARLRELLTTANAMKEAIRVLLDANVLVSKSPNTFRLAPPFEQLAGAAAEADFDSAQEQARWCAHLGDFECLEGHGRAQEVRQARRAWFTAMLDNPQTVGTAIEPLESLLSADEFLRVCGQVIDGPLGPAVGVAIERLEANPEFSTCESVVRLLHRMVPNRDHPFPMHAAAQYLLRRGVEHDHAVAAFLAFARVERVTGYGNPLLGDFALLALEFAQEHALDLVRAALRCSTPIARQMVAAALCGLNRPWCRRELLEALVVHSTPEDAAELLAAICRCGDPEALTAAEHWIGEHPPTPQAGLGLTLGQVALANAEPWLEHEIAQQRAWLERVAPSIPENLDLPS